MLWHACFHGRAPAVGAASLVEKAVHRRRPERDPILQIRADVMIILALLTVLLVLAMCSTAPFWGHSRSWGYGPSGGAGVLLLIVLCIWFFMSRS